MSVQAYLGFTVPGGTTPEKLEQNDQFRWIKEKFPEGEMKDTHPAWGNLDQNWWIVETDIETSWSWCRPLSLSEGDWEYLFNELENGNLVMTVYYVDRNENGEIDYTAHH